MDVVDGGKYLAVTELLPAGNNGVGMVFPHNQKQVAFHHPLFSMETGGHRDAGKVVSVSSQPSHVPQHVQIADDVGGSQLEPLGQDSGQGLRITFVDNSMFGQSRSLVIDKAIPLFVLSGSYAGPEMNRHLVHQAVVADVGHRFSSFLSLSYCNSGRTNRARLPNSALRRPSSMSVIIFTTRSLNGVGTPYLRPMAPT